MKPVFAIIRSLAFISAATGCGQELAHRDTPNWTDDTGLGQSNPEASKGEKPAENQSSDRSLKSDMPFIASTEKDDSKTFELVPGLSAVARLTFENTGTGLSSCLGVYLNEGVLVTAAHCLRTDNGVVGCPADLKITWLTSGAKIFSQSGRGTRCRQVYSKWTSNREKFDLAAVKLEKFGSWPVEPFSMVTGALSKETPIASLIPNDVGEPGSYIVTAGLFNLMSSETTGGTTLMSKAGASGGPIVLTDETPFQANRKLFGIHLGPATIHPAGIIADFMSEAQSEFQKSETPAANRPGDA